MSWQTREEIIPFDTDPLEAAPDILLKDLRALVVEDAAPLGAVYQQYLQRMGFSVDWVRSVAEAIAVLESGYPTLVLLDLHLPDGHGQEVLQRMRQDGMPCPCIVMTAHGSVDSVVDSMQGGAADFLEKPFTAERLEVTVDNALDKARLSHEVQEIREQLPRDGYAGFVGSSEAMQKVYRIIDSAATSRASVFITGESGTGKELCAQAIHERSNRSGRPFVAINCGAIPRELFESEIFGHVKGAFSGASSDRVGAAERADGGTLFLDEIGEMDLDLQVKLLRFIQTGVFQRVGGNKDIRVNVRFVCATNRDPEQQVAEGNFREDLFYRLNVIPIQMPALRERGEDVLAIAEAFLEDLSAEEGRHFRGFDDAARGILQAYNWPGNVRQMHNVVHNIVLLNDGQQVAADMLPEPLGSGVIPLGSSLPEIAQRSPIPVAAPSRVSTLPEGIVPLAEVERRAIESAIAQCDGNVPIAAAHLRVSASTLYRKLKSWKGQAA